MRVLGLAGWSGAGKTTLLVRLLPLLRADGLRVSTVKHAHHGFDVDRPGKDSFRHRDAGAGEVLVASARRWVLMHETTAADGAEAEPRLSALLRRLSPCDLVLAEGFKSLPHPKLEVHRAAVGRPPLFPGDPAVVAVASDVPLPGAPIPVLHLDDVPALAALVRARAAPLGDVLATLDEAGA